MIRVTDEDAEAIAEKLANKLAESRNQHWVESELHYQDHQWVQQRRKDEADMRLFRTKAIQGSVMWVLLAGLAYIGLAIWKAVILAIKAALI